MIDPKRAIHIVRNAVTATVLDPAEQSAQGERLRRVSRQGEQIAGRFKRAMQLRGLTVRELARLALVSPPSVMRVRNGGGHQMTAAMLGDLAKALEVSPGWLVYGEGEPPDGL